MTPERAAEFIALLTAKSQPFEPALAAFDRIRREDVVSAIGMINSLPARLLARVKYAEQDIYAGKLAGALDAAIERGALAHVVDNLSPAKRWKVPRKSFVLDMCRLAVIELMSPHLCRECKGRGQVLRLVEETGGFIKDDCKMCLGSCIGPSPFKDIDRANFLEVSPDAYCHSWKERYEAIYTLLEKYENITKGALAKRLSAIA